MIGIGGVRAGSSLSFAYIRQAASAVSPLPCQMPAGQGEEGSLHLPALVTVPGRVVEYR